ncbi:MAG: hypothetical protein ABJC13_06970 [Acidobacteriota bacterium]
MSGRLLRPRALSAAVLLSLFFPALSSAAAPPETFRDQLAVREAEIVVGLPPALQAERDRSLRPEDFVVRIDGEPHKVLRLLPLGGERSPWRLVVVVDPALAHPDTIVASLLSLASESDAVASFGTVDLATFDSLNSKIGWIGRNLSGAQSIELTLAEAAGRARSDRRRNDPHREISPAVAAGHLAAIARFLLADGGGGPRALALPLDPIASSNPTDFGVPTGDIAATSRLLASYGWTLLPLGLDARTTFGLDGPGVSAYDHWNDTSFVGRGVDVLGILRWLRGKRAVPPPRARVTIEAETLPGFGAARGLAEATGGIPIDRSEQIRPTLEALGHRYVLGYEVSAEPKTGEIVSVAVTSARGSSPAVSPHFARTGASQDLADLLLAGLLEGDPPRKDLPVTAKLADGKLLIDLPASAEDAPPLGPLRISWTIRHAGAADETHHDLVLGPAAGDKPLHREIALPPGTDPAAAAVLIQTIGSEAVWGERLGTPVG